MHATLGEPLGSGELEQPEGIRLRLLEAPLFSRGRARKVENRALLPDYRRGLEAREGKGANLVELPDRSKRPAE